MVEYHSEQATFNVDKGAENLEKARVLQIKALKVSNFCSSSSLTELIIPLIFSLEKNMHINMGDIHFGRIDNNYVDFVTASFY